MRRMIGGELALNRLLLLPPRHAAFQAAIWLMPTAPVQMQKAVDWGVIGTLEGKNVLVRLVAQHESMPVTVQQVIEALKEARGHRAESCLLCLTAPLSKEGAAYAETANPPIRVIQREELVRLAGLSIEATRVNGIVIGEDLGTVPDFVRNVLARHGLLGTTVEWFARVDDSPNAGDPYADPSTYRKYALALLTGQWVYPFPAAVCLALFAGCKLREIRAEHARG